MFLFILNYIILNRLYYVNVYAGSTYQLTGQVYEIAPEKITTHENFLRNPRLNDIALLETKKKIAFSSNTAFFLHSENFSKTYLCRYCPTCQASDFKRVLISRKL